MNFLNRGGGGGGVGGSFLIYIDNMLQGCMQIVTSGEVFMKRQSLFSGINKTKNIKMSSAEVS